MSMESGQEERERAATLAKTVETAAAKCFWPGVGRGCARS